MLVEEDEGEERLEQSRLSDAPQEEVEVRCGGHHLLQGQLHRVGGGQSGRSDYGTTEHIRSTNCSIAYTFLSWGGGIIRLHVMWHSSQNESR